MTFRIKKKMAISQQLVHLATLIVCVTYRSQKRPDKTHFSYPPLAGDPTTSVLNAAVLIDAFGANIFYCPIEAIQDCNTYGFVRKKAMLAESWCEYNEA